MGVLNPLAFIGLDRQVQTLDLDSGLTRTLTGPMPRAAGNWSMLVATEEGWSWPTWSPDGKEIAAFSAELTDGTPGAVRVATLDLDGVRQVQWADLPASAPVYLQWHPSGEALSLLLQQGGELVLAMVRRSRLGKVRPLETGVPLFFNWTPSGERVFVHVGTKERPDGRLILRDPLGSAEDVQHDRAPGSFCAPIFVAGEAVYALQREDGGSDVVRGSPDGQNVETLFSRRGLLAVLPAPNGSPQIAVSCAPGGEHSPYQGIEVLDVQSGRSRTLTDSKCFAFFWSPQADFIVYAVVDGDNNCLFWYRVSVDGGSAEPLGSFWPTRETLFYLRFFDQYASSHPMVSPDARHIVFAGYPAGGGQADLSGPPRIFVKELDSPAPPVEMARGSFAVFPTARA